MPGSGERRPVVHMSVVGTIVPGKNDAFIYGCIESFLATAGEAPCGVRITAIDNSPGLGLGAQLHERFPSIAVRSNTVRRGFAANHNQVMANSDAEYFLVANDDLTFLPGSLARAVRYLEDPFNSRVGVVSFQLLNADRSIQPSTFSFPTVFRGLLALSHLRERIPFGAWTTRLAAFASRGRGRSRFWDHDRTLPVDTTFGAALLVRAAAVRAVGLMDEVALLGVEETEWHRRFWNEGWSVVFIHDAPVMHYDGQTNRAVSSLEVEYLKGLLNFFQKHRPEYVARVFSGLALPIIGMRLLLAGARRDVATRGLLRNALRVVWAGALGRGPDWWGGIGRQEPATGAPAGGVHSGPT